MIFLINEKIVDKVLKSKEVLTLEIHQEIKNLPFLLNSVQQIISHLNIFLLIRIMEYIIIQVQEVLSLIRTKAKISTCLSRKIL